MAANLICILLREIYLHFFIRKQVANTISVNLKGNTKLLFRQQPINAPIAEMMMMIRLGGIFENLLLPSGIKCE
jgi:hypothetical protein